MYSIVLATMLTTGTAAPDWGCHGCHGCCGGCWGCCGGCWGCCGGCWGCCGGCWGCCGGCWGCWGGGWSYGWYSVWPYPDHGWSVGFYGSCYGCWGTCFGCHGCYGCYGCYGNCYGGLPLAGTTTAPAPAPTPVIPAPPKKDEEKKKSSYLGNAAEVIVKAPAGVQLLVEDRILSRTAGEQTFRTPELEPGYSYTYTFQARAVRDGKTVAYVKQVKVRAGQTSVADFTKLTSEGKDTAGVTVKLPADARLYVDGVLCPLTSATRTFRTPELDAGRRYYYTLKAEMVRDGQTRTVRKRVIVEAGKEVTVEFADLPLHTASR